MREVPQVVDTPLQIGSTAAPFEQAELPKHEVPPGTVRHVPGCRAARKTAGAGAGRVATAARAEPAAALVAPRAGDAAAGGGTHWPVALHAVPETQSASVVHEAAQTLELAQVRRAVVQRAAGRRDAVADRERGYAVRTDRTSQAGGAAGHGEACPLGAGQRARLASTGAGRVATEAARAQPAAALTASRACDAVARGGDTLARGVAPGARYAIGVGRAGGGADAGVGAEVRRAVARSAAGGRDTVAGRNRRHAVRTGRATGTGGAGRTMTQVPAPRVARKTGRRRCRGCCNRLRSRRSRQRSPSRTQVPPAVSWCAVQRRAASISACPAAVRTEAVVSSRKTAARRSGPSGRPSRRPSHNGKARFGSSCRRRRPPPPRCSQAAPRRTCSRMKRPSGIH